MKVIVCVAVMTFLLPRGARAVNCNNFRNTKQYAVKAVAPYYQARSYGLNFRLSGQWQPNFHNHYGWAKRTSNSIRVRECNKRESLLAGSGR